MAFVAREEVGTTFFVIHYEVGSFPINTRQWCIEENVRLSPEVLPIVCVDAQSFVMLRQVEWTKNSFVVKNEEIIVKFVVVYQFYLYVGL